MGKFFNVLARFREPSTWAAIATLGVAFSANTDVMQHIATAGPVLAGLLGVFLPEVGQTDQAAQ